MSLLAFSCTLNFVTRKKVNQFTSQEKGKSRSEREHYYLFLGLISIKADDTVWKLQSKYDYNFGWILKCTHLEQFFSSRFLQVLLLRLAFSFALETSCDNPNQSIGIHQNCYLWKNGTFWGSVFGMQTRPWLKSPQTKNQSFFWLVFMMLIFKLCSASFESH